MENKFLCLFLILACQIVVRENVIFAYYFIICIHLVKHVQRTLSYHKLFRMQYTMKKYFYYNIDQLRNRNEIINKLNRIENIKYQIISNETTQKFIICNRVSEYLNKFI